MVVGIVGRGPWGQNLERTLRRDPRVEEVIVRGREWRDLLERRLSGLVVACPPAAHIEVAAPFLERGVPLFLEKPLALTVADAETLAGMAAARPSVPILVNHNALFSDLWSAVARDVGDRVRSGAVLTAVDVHWTGSRERTDCPVLWDYGPHALAPLLAVFGAARDIHAVRHPRGRSSEVLLELGFARGDFEGRALLGVDPQRVRKIVITLTHGDVLETWTFDDDAKSATRTSHDARNRSLPEATAIATERTLPLTNAVRVFVDAIEGKPDHRLGAALALDVVRHLERAARSIE